jgi:hypothetical protein
MLVFFTVLMPKMTTGTGDRAEKEGLLKPGGPSGQSRTVVGASLDQAKATACKSNLDQIRTLVKYAQAQGEPLPASIRDMRLGSAACCPVSQQLYQYDPNTGTAKCLTPGHEGL